MISKTRKLQIKSNLKELFHGREKCEHFECFETAHSVSARERPPINSLCFFCNRPQLTKIRNFYKTIYKEDGSVLKKVAMCKSCGDSCRKNLLSWKNKLEGHLIRKELDLKKFPLRKLRYSNILSLVKEGASLKGKK